ncbi:hypothetical protein [Pontibacter actiniarum]|uniref:hypothetical protein n=1 Tax=Pontibacter actiniarum TaxID=323450 RepID=UPI00040C2E69|nr:hypothetical protein [Pontibacter actiniarum]
MQEALLHEKQPVIENCLFGGDIDPSLAETCHLHLWTALHQDAYYQQETGSYSLCPTSAST